MYTYKVIFCGLIFKITNREVRMEAIIFKSIFKIGWLTVKTTKCPRYMVYYNNNIQTSLGQAVLHELVKANWLQLSAMMNKITLVHKYRYHVYNQARSWDESTLMVTDCTLSVMRSSKPKSIATLMGLASLDDIFLNFVFGRAAACVIIYYAEIASQQ